MTDTSSPAVRILTGSVPVDAVLALADAARAADGHPPLSDQTRVHVARGTAVAVLLAGPDEAPDAAAVLVPEGEAAVLELVVHPRARRRGVARAMAEEAAAVVRAEGLQDSVSVWAHGMLPGSAELASAHGLTPVRELRRMTADAATLAPLAAPELPEGVRLRSYVPGSDDAAWLELNAAAFADHPEQGSLTQDDLEDRRGEDWFDPAGFLLAEREEDGALLGYHWTKVEGDGTVGEVYAVGVSPQAQGLGLGRALTVAGLVHMRAAGVRRVELYVDADNTAAVRLYETLGFVLDAADAQYRPA
ncbi:mycothiol synthase [Micrococcus luteus]